jgi:CheY-like chemotaxis protein
MATNERDLEIFRALLAKNKCLAQELQSKSVELDQLFAERKECVRGSFRTPTGPRSEDSEPRRTAGVKPPVLVIVEDDQDDFMLLKRALYKAGATARVWWAHNAQEAISLIAELENSTSSICLVMDVRLTGVDGFELLEQVRARAKVPGGVIKCAFLTGMCDDETRNRAKVEGADAFFEKPTDSAQMVEVARALQRLAAA